MRRMRAGTVAVVAGVVMAVAAAMTGGGRARACSIDTPNRDNIATIVEMSQVIAIGRWAEATDLQVTFVVEDAIRGTETGERFVLDNRNNSPTRACGGFEQPGRRFTSGDGAIVFLEQMNGQWQIAWGGSAVDGAPRDALAPVFGYSTPKVGLEVARAAASATAPGGSDAAERLAGCTPSAEGLLERYLDAASVVAIVRVVEPSRPGQADVAYVPVRVAVDEWLAGTLPSEPLWVDDRERWGGPGTSCVPEVGEYRSMQNAGERYLVFLREEGDGIYRPAAWGRAAWRVNEAYVVGNAVTVREIRAMVDEGRDNADWFVPATTVALVLAAAATVVAGARAGVRR